MSANTAPISSRVGDIQWNTVITGNTATDGTGTSALIFTADATNGGRIERVRLLHLGTDIATVVRLFVNNGLPPATAANNALLLETTMAANTISQTAASVAQEIALAIALPPGYAIYATVGTTVAAGIRVIIIGGKY